jgi:hypothetical protein
MPWKKNSPDAIHRFDALVAVKGAKRGVLFGCPIYVLGGERYATLYQNQIVLRLSPADAADLISKGGRAFEPINGRRSKDRVILPNKIAANRPRRLHRPGSLQESLDTI